MKPTTVWKRVRKKEALRKYKRGELVQSTLYTFIELSQ
jgi:hypothetical protein